MKRVYLLAHIFSSFTQFVTAQEKIPKECFGYSSTMGRRDIGKLVNNMDQILTNEFRYDMRLYKIIRCLASGNLTGLTFVLGTVGTNPVQTLELESLGFRYGSDCQEVTIPKDQSIVYLEITYNSDQVTSFFAKLSDSKTNYLYGSRKTGDSTKNWSFNDENLLAGLLGTEQNGIASLGVVTYQPACADKALGFDVDPTNGNKNYIPGVYTQDEQNKDGTFQFAQRTMRLRNPDILPKMIAQKNIWSLDNPNLASDLANWAITSPNYYYWGAGVLVIFLSIVACICCCWQQGCCRRCCCPNKTKVGQDTEKDKEENSNVEMVKKKIKTSDVLNEQGTCEDIGEDDGLPSQRRLVSLETATNEGLPSHKRLSSTFDEHKPSFGQHKIISNQDKGFVNRELEEQKERRQILAEQIMYGSALTKIQRQDSAESKNRDDLAQLYNSRFVDNRLDSMVSPPETRDSYRQVNLSYQQPTSQIQIQTQMGMHQMQMRIPNGSNMNGGPILPASLTEMQQQMDLKNNNASYLNQHPIQSKFYSIHPLSDRPVTQIEQQNLKRIPPENYYNAPARTTLKNYSTESGSELFPGQVQPIVSYLTNQSQQTTVQNGPKMQEGYMSNPDLHTFESKPMWPADQISKPQVYENQQPVNFQSSQFNMAPQVRRESHLDRQVLPENQQQQQHLQQQQQAPKQPQYQQARQQQTLQSPQQNSAHQSYQNHPSQTDFVENVRSLQPQPTQQIYKHQPSEQGFVQNSLPSHLHPSHQIYQNTPSQLVFVQDEQHRTQRVEHETVHHIDQPINHGSIHVPMSASLDASSIGRASYPETPNNLISPQVEKLVNQVENLQKQLDQVQRQQTFRDTVQVQNRQNPSAQPSQKTEDQMYQIQPPPIPKQQQSYAKIEPQQVYQNNQQRESNSPRGDFDSSQISYMEQLAQANMRQKTNQPEPIIVQVNPRPRQEQISLPADTNLQILKHQYGGTIVNRNNSMPSKFQNGGQSTSLGQQKQMTQADIDEQFRDIPELGGDHVAKGNEDVERMFNYGQKTTISSQPSTQPNQGHTFQTSKIYYNGQPSAGSRTANISAQLGFEGQPERTTTSVIEKLSQIAEAAPMSIPQRHTPSPTYFTK